MDAALRGLGLAAGAAPRRWFVPGRIEVLGKHTDYGGGRSLLCAIGRGFCVSAAPRSDRTVRIADAGRGLTGEVSARRGPRPVGDGLDGVRADGGVAPRAELSGSAAGRRHRLRERPAARVGNVELERARGRPLHGALGRERAAGTPRVRRRDPRARGPRRLPRLPRERARASALSAGDRGVGTFGGSEDQTAILCCRAGEIAQYAFCPVRHERSMPLERDWSFVVASSGVASDKTGDARESYNRLSLAVSAILALWNRSTGRHDESLFAALTETPDAPARIRSLLRLLPVEGFSREFLGGAARPVRWRRRSASSPPSATCSPGARSAWWATSWTARRRSPSRRSATRCPRRLRSRGWPASSARPRPRHSAAASAAACGRSCGRRTPTRSGAAGPIATRRRFRRSTEQSRFFVTRPGPAVVAL